MKQNMRKLRVVPLGYTKGGIGAHELSESEPVDVDERREAACRCWVKTGRGICGGGAVMFDGDA
jgi:hypothetical protein